MSLTTADLQEIRAIMHEVVDPLAGEIQALRNDIKEVYSMITELQSMTITDKDFRRRSLEEKLLTLNAELIVAAKQAGVRLPLP